MKFKLKPRKTESLTLKTLGLTLVTFAVVMLPSLMYQIADGCDVSYFLVPMIALLVIGLPLVLMTKMPTTMDPVFMLANMVLMWGFAVACGSLPFMMYGLSPIDSIFESTSGVMTAGSSIVSSVHELDRGIILWRSVLQWIGGIAIIVMFILVLPTIGFGNRALLVNETSGSDAGKVSIKLKDTGKQFITVYSIATIIILVVLTICGLSFFDSFCISLSTISLGGFSPTDNSVSEYSDIIKIVIIISLLFGSTNFYLHYKSVISKKLVYLGSEEFRAMLVIMGLLLLVCVPYLLANTDDSLINIIFNTISAVTTASFAASDYSLYPIAIVCVFFAITIIGGSAGSTAGGLKVNRLLISVKNIYNEIQRLLHPNAVYDVKMDGKSVDSVYISSTMMVLVIFLITMLVSTGVFLFMGLPFDVSLLTTISSLTCYGASVGPYGPFGSFYAFSDAAKIFMCILMWIGRVEIVSALIVFTPGYWREFRLSVKNIRRKPSSQSRR